MRGMTTVERADPPYEADERTMLDAWLEYHRATLLMKCEGLTDDQLRMRRCRRRSSRCSGSCGTWPRSRLNWFRFWLGGEGPNRRATDDDEDFDVDGADVGGGVRLLARRVRATRDVVAPFGSLDDVGAGQTPGADLGALDTRAHDRGVRPPQRPRRLPPRVHRRRHRRLTNAKRGSRYKNVLVPAMSTVHAERTGQMDIPGPVTKRDVRGAGRPKGHPPNSPTCHFGTKGEARPTERGAPQ